MEQLDLLDLPEQMEQLDPQVQLDLWVPRDQQALPEQMV